MGALGTLRRGLQILSLRRQRASETRFRSTIEGSPLGVNVFSPDGRSLLTNAAWKRLWGAGEGNVLRDERFRDSGLTPFVERGISGVPATTPPLPVDGKDEADVRWLRGYVHPLRDGSGRVIEVVLMVEDVTGEQNVRAELEKSEQRFSSLVKNASDLITVIEAGGKILYVSPSVTRVLGFGPEDLVGADLFDFLHLEDLGVIGPAFSAGFGRVGATGDRVEYRFRHKDGAYRTLEGVATDLTEDPSVRGIVINARDVTDRKALEDEISQQAFRDPLTGLANRALFVDRLDQALARLTRQPKPFAVLLMDLDNFRVVNDSMGPKSGDAVLVAFAERLRQLVRPQDTVARFGEDEFGVLLESQHDLGGAVRVAERVAGTLLSIPFVVDGRSLYLGVSIGIVLGARSLEEPREILRKTDAALREAKRKGKGRFEIFDESLDADALARLRLEDELKSAVANGEFTVRYAPVLSIPSGEKHALEALTYWDHPGRGLLPAGEFMGVAEDAGLAAAIGEATLRQVCRQGAAWAERYPEGRTQKLDVRLTKGQLVREDLSRKVEQVLIDTGMRASGLSFEVDEGLLAEDGEEVLRSLISLGNLGALVTVDGFGTGRAPLARLNRLPLDTLKLDRSLTVALDDDPRQRSLLEAVIGFAHALGHTVTAREVESAEQLVSLRQLGCDYAQGSVISETLTADAATALLDTELNRRTNREESQPGPSGTDASNDKEQGT